MYRLSIARTMLQIEFVIVSHGPLLLSTAVQWKRLKTCPPVVQCMGAEFSRCLCCRLELSGSEPERKWPTLFVLESKLALPQSLDSSLRHVSQMQPDNCPSVTAQALMGSNPHQGCHGDLYKTPFLLEFDWFCPRHKSMHFLRKPCGRLLFCHHTSR